MTSQQFPKVKKDYTGKKLKLNENLTVNGLPYQLLKDLNWNIEDEIVIINYDYTYRKIVIGKKLSGQEAKESLQKLSEQLSRERCTPEPESIEQTVTEQSDSQKKIELEKITELYIIGHTCKSGVGFHFKMACNTKEDAIKAVDGLNKLNDPKVIINTYEYRKIAVK